MAMMFPLPFLRQFSGPLDVDLVFDTDATLQAYLINPLRYAGQIVSCAEHEGKVFVLNNDRDIWLEVSGSGSGGGHVIQDEGTPLTQREALNFTNKFNIIDNLATNSTDIDLQSELALAWYEFDTDQTPGNKIGCAMDVQLGPLSVTLSVSPLTREHIGVKDLYHNASINNIVILCNGNPIEGTTDDVIIDVDSGLVELMWIGAPRGWVVINY